MADEHPRPPASLTRSSPADLAHAYALAQYGALWLDSFEILHQQAYEDGALVVFRVLNPLVAPRQDGPRPTATLIYGRRDGAWALAGGGAIGTIAAMDRFAVSCAWTWLNRAPAQQSVAAFYCTVEDPRVAGVELETVEGADFRADTAGRRVVVFPYAWDATASPMAPKQLPRAIRLFDGTQRPLALSTSPVASTPP